MAVQEIVGLQPEFQEVPLVRSGTSAFIIKPLEIASAGLLVLLITLVLVGVSFRYFLRMPLLWVDEAASSRLHLVEHAWGSHRH